MLNCFLCYWNEKLSKVQINYVKLCVQYQDGSHLLKVTSQILWIFYFSFFFFQCRLLEMHSAQTYLKFSHWDMHCSLNGISPFSICYYKTDSTFLQEQLHKLILIHLQHLCVNGSWSHSRPQQLLGNWEWTKEYTKKKESKGDAICKYCHPTDRLKQLIHISSNYKLYLPSQLHNRNCTRLWASKNLDTWKCCHNSLLSIVLLGVEYQQP